MDTCPNYATSIWALHVRETAGSFSYIFLSVILCHNLVSAVMPVGSSVISVGSVVFPVSSLIRDKMC